MYPHDRLDVCVAAKKYIKDVVPKFDHSNIDDPKMLMFTFTTDAMEKLLAIDCATDPPMYVHFREEIRERLHKVRPILVMWIKSEKIPEINGMADDDEDDDDDDESKSESNGERAKRMDE